MLILCTVLSVMTFISMQTLRFKLLFVGGSIPESGAGDHGSRPSAWAGGGAEQDTS